MGKYTSMRLLGKTLATFFILLTILSVVEIITPITNSFGSDFNPPKNTVTSFHLSNFMSDDEDFSYLEKQMNRFLSREGVAGASVAIAKDGQLVYSKGFGYADIEQDQKVSPHHLFRVASISKLITAAGIMRLVEDGYLSLDSKVFGPEGLLNDSIYLNYRDKRVEEITVNQLLNHSGGWTTRWGDQMFMPTTIARSLKKELPVNKQDIIQFALKKRLHFKPGTASYYSNLGFMILGEVISKVSKSPYESYIETNILYPLGIYDMQIGGSYLHERAEYEVKYYEPEKTFYVEDYTGSGEKVLRTYGGNDMHSLGAAGGWIASSTDLMKILLSLDGFKTVPDVLTDESIQTMVARKPGYSPLGWRNIGVDGWYRTGTLAGTSAIMVRKNNGISYVVLTNSGNWKGPRLAREISRSVDRGLRRIKNWPKDNLFDFDDSWASVKKRPQVIF